MEKRVVWLLKEQTIHAVKWWRKYSLLELLTKNPTQVRAHGAVFKHSVKVNGNIAKFLTTIYSVYSGIQYHNALHCAVFVPALLGDALLHFVLHLLLSPT